ncbi:MAG: four helix bundle protein, partial [Verrucomicrobia bacterium]|nr:four helix bundle protein [Verrucomicrobiota bacterium]
MKNFRELTGWQQSHRLALTVYAAMRVFPKVEQYGDTSQTRRACTSIPTNIAKGCGRA